MESFEWHDSWRVLVAVSCTWALWILHTRFIKHGESWNPKTRDYWFSLVMWCLAGLVLSIQNVFLNAPLGPSLVFSTMAAMVTIRGLCRKGEWGALED